MAVVFNSTSSVDEIAASATTLAWNHTCNAADTKLMVCVNGRDTISGVTYNGVAMTKARETALLLTIYYTSIWYLDNPTTGSSLSITATFTTGSTNRSGAATGLSNAISGIGTTAEASNSGNPNTCTATETTVGANSILFGALWCNEMNGSPGTRSFGAGQTHITNNTVDTKPGFYLDQLTTTTAGSYSMSEGITGTGLNHVIVLAEIKVNTPSTNYLIYGRPRTRSTSNPISLG